MTGSTPDRVLRRWGWPLAPTQWTRTLSGLKLRDRGHTGWHVSSGRPALLERASLDFRRAGRSRASQCSSKSSGQCPYQARRAGSGPVSNGVLGLPSSRRAPTCRSARALRTTRPDGPKTVPKRSTVVLSGTIREFCWLGRHEELLRAEAPGSHR